MLVSALTFYYSYRQAQKSEEFSLKLTESRVTGKKLTLTSNNSTFHLTVPIRIMITNTSGITQPIERVDVTMDRETNYYWDHVFEINGQKMMFPKDIPSKGSYGIEIWVDIPIAPKTAEEIIKLYSIKKFTEGIPYQLSELEDFENKLKTIKFDNGSNLYNLTRHKLTVDFYFLSASEGIGITNYPLMLP